MQLGFIGLGKMGSRMVLKLLSEGHEVVVWNRSLQSIEELKTQNSKLKNTTQNLKTSETMEELVKNLSAPRVIWSMLPAGEATENILQEIGKFIESGDIVVDGGNANYKDTQRRYNKLRSKNIKFLGIGVSGGIIAATNGYPLMVGGDKNGYDYIIPILDSLAKPNGGHAYLGEGGAGHFVKMIHNGVEYGMMQAISEGFDVLCKSEYNFDLQNIARVWQKGSIVSSFLIERAKEALEKDPQLVRITGIIPRGGEGDWTVETAKEEKVNVPIIEGSLNFRKQSETDTTIQNSFTAKMVNALRHEFGGHEVKKE